MKAEKESLVPMLPPGAEIAPGLRVLGHLKRGSYLDIYDVWSEERDCRCVVKTLRPDKVDDFGRKALIYEGRLLQRLAHPHLVRAYSVLTRPRTLLVLETLSGATLGRIMEEGLLPPQDAAIMGMQLCSAIGYLHRNGVLHLDLKPDNIVAQGGLAKVLDLSIARPPGIGRPGVGTPAYMAPEQKHGRFLSPATDVWGLGAVLFEALTGKLPRRKGREPNRLPRRFPAPLREAVESCLVRRPQGRPTVAELSDMLKSIAG